MFKLWKGCSKAKRWNCSKSPRFRKEQRKYKVNLLSIDAEQVRAAEQGVLIFDENKIRIKNKNDGRNDSAGRWTEEENIIKKLRD